MRGGNAKGRDEQGEAAFPGNFSGIGQKWGISEGFGILCVPSIQRHQGIPGKKFLANPNTPEIPSPGDKQGKFPLGRDKNLGIAGWRGRIGTALPGIRDCDPGFSSRESGVFWDEIGSKPFPRCRIPGIPTFIPKKPPSEKARSSNKRFQAIQEFLFHAEFRQNSWEGRDFSGNLTP